MQVITEFVDVDGDAGVVRCAVARPASKAHAPLLLCFSDIFGNTESHLRVMRRFAGHGYVVVSPEPWARFHPPGTVLDFDADRQRALDAADRGDVDAADADRAAVVAHMKKTVAAPGPHVALGFCYGGHLAFRAAFDAAAVGVTCCYGTGIHVDKLGAGAAPSLARAAHPQHGIHGELLLVWGRNDPHIPAAGRALIHRTLDDAGVKFETRLYAAEHAFARDVGPRHDPAATDDAFAAALALFSRTLRG
jgi:carboxymethylenebutenolidase